MRTMKYKFIRDVSTKDRNFYKDEIVFGYSGYSYGCISPSGIACCEKAGETPFFEIPGDALKRI